MIITKLQEPPDHPVYEVAGFKLGELGDWLCGLEEEDVSVSIRDNVYHFRTALERKQFVLGMELGFQHTWDFLCGVRG